MIEEPVWRLLGLLIVIFFILKGIIIQFWKIKKFTQCHSKYISNFVKGAYLRILAVSMNNIVYCGLP